MRVGHHDVEITRADKVFYPDDGITKGDLVDYYADVSAWMLPYLRDRPLAMARHPDGIEGRRIFAKNVPGYFPGWIDRTPVAKQDGSLTQVVCDRPETLVYLANQACIEPHVFLSRTDRIHRPDQLVFDLDPPDADRFPLARRCALILRELLDGLDLPADVKTTGGKGLHVHVALDARDGFDAVRSFAREIAEFLAWRHGDWVTAEQRRNKRGERLFVDVMRNAYAQTAIAPYAVRARPGAPVATPLHWAEVEDGRLRPDRFTLRSVRGRLERADDPWAGFGRRRRRLSHAYDRLRDRRPH
jgi:bifunctional non-homologous end joining protein LigD